MPNLGPARSPTFFASGASSDTGAEPAACRPASRLLAHSSTVLHRGIPSGCTSEALSTSFWPPLLTPVPIRPTNAAEDAKPQRVASVRSCEPLPCPLCVSDIYLSCNMTLSRYHCLAVPTARDFAPFGPARKPAYEIAERIAADRHAKLPPWRPLPTEQAMRVRWGVTALSCAAVAGVAGRGIGPTRRSLAFVATMIGRVRSARRGRSTFCPPRCSKSLELRFERRGRGRRLAAARASPRQNARVRRSPRRRRCPRSRRGEIAVDEDFASTAPSPRHR